MINLQCLRFFQVTQFCFLNSTNYFRSVLPTSATRKPFSGSAAINPTSYCRKVILSTYLHFCIFKFIGIFIHFLKSLIHFSSDSQTTLSPWRRRPCSTRFSSPPPPFSINRMTRGDMRLERDDLVLKPRARQSLDSCVGGQNEIQNDLGPRSTTGVDRLRTTRLRRRVSVTGGAVQHIIPSSCVQLNIWKAYLYANLVLGFKVTDKDIS